MDAQIALQKCVEKIAINKKNQKCLSWVEGEKMGRLLARIARYQLSDIYIGALCDNSGYMCNISFF